MAEKDKLAYPLKDVAEAKRLRNQHTVIRDAMGGGLILAPVDMTASPLRILDSGTSDGTWIRDIAETHAGINHQFVGTDINTADFPEQPPAGTSYQYQNINDPWPEEWRASFDLVHQRLVLAAAGPEQKKRVQALAALVKPGGWIQLVEGTHHFPKDRGPFMSQFVDLLFGMFTFMGCDLEVAQHMGEWLAEAGFVDVQDRVVEMKLGALNENKDLAEIGVLSTTAAATGLAGAAKGFPPGTINLTPEQLDTIGSNLENELRARGSIFPLRVVWARKST